MQELTVDLSRLEPKTSSDIKPDLCKCSTCGGEFHISECETDHDYHDGHEMSPYSIHLCPVCPDGGCIDDYNLSEELLLLWDKMKMAEEE